MSFSKGNVVRVGKGKVEYAISEVNADGTVNLTGEKSNRKNVDTDTLTLVASDVFDTPAPEKLTSGTEHPMAIWEVELTDAAGDPKRPYLLTVDHVTTAHKTYNAACDALILAARTGFKHYAVIDHQGERKATRTAA